MTLKSTKSVLLRLVHAYHRSVCLLQRDLSWKLCEATAPYFDASHVTGHAEDVK